MARGLPIETVREGRGDVEGSKHGSSSAATKAEARGLGRDMTRERTVEHHIHRIDGTIGERTSYGNDPRRSPG